LQRVEPILLSFDHHSVEVICRNIRGCERPNACKTADGESERVMRCRCDNYRVLRKLQSICADGNTVVCGTSNEGVGLRFIEPDFLSYLTVAFGKRPIRASPQSAEPCFDDGANALDETCVVGAPRHTLLSSAILCSKVVDLHTKVVYPLSGSEDGCPRRLILLWSTGIGPQQCQVADVEAVRHHDFTGTAMNVEIDTGASLGCDIWKCIKRPQKGLRVGGPVSDITGSFG
jgi:hypothetical protein